MRPIQLIDNRCLAVVPQGVIDRGNVIGNRDRIVDRFGGQIVAFAVNLTGSLIPPPANAAML